jgi:hypothetical protein
MTNHKLFFKNFKSILLFVSCALSTTIFFNNCSSGGGGGGGASSSVAAIPSYCPYLPSKTFSSAVNVSGRAVYEYRVNGNAEVANGEIWYSPNSLSGIQTFTVTVLGVNYSWTSGAIFTAQNVATNLAAAINGSSTAPIVGAVVTKSSLYYLSVAPKDETNILAITTTTNLTKSQGASPNAIRYAEVSIRDSAQTIIQCAETDGAGAFSFQIPANSGSFTVSVSPRSFNSNLQAYVLDTPTTNQVYLVSAAVGSTSATNGVQLIASAKNTLEGGAFFILDQLLKANIFLRAYTSSSQGCGAAFADCVSFSVGPLLTAYWKKGVNPAIYQGLNPNSGISYYIPGKAQLYIMGGINGDVDYSDTDHFDPSVIIHEYGHFMEDQYGKSDSPGGSHDAHSQLDPRLAWSEGWADFFQAAVTGSPVYRDTYGTIDGSAGVYFNEDLENLTGTSLDRPGTTPSGEGNYHEFSITRLLWDLIDPHPVTGAGGTTPDENVQGPFAEIWSVFSGPTGGFHSANTHFRSIGYFHLIQNAKAGRTDTATLRAMEYQDADRRNFGAPIATGGACATSTNVSMTTVTASTTDYFRNNRFYAFNHAGGAFDAVLSYTTATGQLADLDLIVYSEAFVFGKSASVVVASQSTPPTNCSSSTQCTEHVSANLAAGFYLINISGLAQNSGATQLNLTINGLPACITN